MQYFYKKKTWDGEKYTRVNLSLFEKYDGKQFIPNRLLQQKFVGTYVLFTGFIDTNDV